MSREKWVPRVNVVKHKDVGQTKLITKAQENVVGSFPRSIFEFGESSRQPCYGPGDKPVSTQIL